MREQTPVEGGVKSQMRKTTPTQTVKLKQRHRRESMNNSEVSAAGLCQHGIHSPDQTGDI